MEKICIKCGLPKEEGAFPFQSYVRGDGSKSRRNECKTCHNKRRDKRRKEKGVSDSRKKAQNKKSVNYYANNDYRRLYMRDKSLAKYGINSDMYEAILLSQNNCCKICGISDKEEFEKYNRSMPVDHCHKTNKIRGIICTDCNVSLGKMKDNPLILRKAAEYLEQNN